MTKNTLDRFDAKLMQSTLWSWTVARPDTGFAEPRAAVVSSYSGRWSDVSSDTGKIFGYACRNSDPGACMCLRAGTHIPSLSPPFRPGALLFLAISYHALGGLPNPDDHDNPRYAVLPRAELRFDWQVVPAGGTTTSVSGEFFEAEPACESVEVDGASGYVFGAPRTAHENKMLQLQMQVGQVDAMSRCVLSRLVVVSSNKCVKDKERYLSRGFPRPHEFQVSGVSAQMRTETSRHLSFFMVCFRNMHIF